MICVVLLWCTIFPKISSRWCYRILSYLSHVKARTALYIWVSGKTEKTFFDPQTRPVVMIIFAQIPSVRPYVPTFQNIAKQNKRRVKIMINTGGTVGLAEGIIVLSKLFWWMVGIFPSFQLFLASVTQKTWNRMIIQRAIESVDRIAKLEEE